MQMLNETQLGEAIDSRFTRTLFRLEVLDRYDVATDGADYDRYLRGEVGPDPARKEPWLETLRREAAEGKYSHRVHVLTSPLTDYLRYECEWGYAYNAAAGEDIRILDLAEIRRPVGLVDEDFWLIDNTHAVRMHYGPGGTFAGAELVPPDAVPCYRAARDAAWAVAVPFPAWWAEHPRYWRTNWLAA